MPKLLLIRYCQTTGRHPDAPLSEAGAKAAEALVTRLHDLAPDAVYSSPYERALDVGRLVGFVRLDALRPRRRRVEEDVA